MLDVKAAIEHHEFERRSLEHEFTDLSLGSDYDKKMMRKLDLHLLPILTTLYLLSFIDRANIGNAKIEGLANGPGSLHLTGKLSLSLLLFQTLVSKRISSI